MANNVFVVDQGIVVGNVSIWAANGDIITTGNIINNSFSGGGPINVVTGSASSGYANSTLVDFPGSTTSDPVDFATVVEVIGGVATVETESYVTNVIPTVDAFGAQTNKYSSRVEIYDAMEPAGSVETADLGTLP